MDSSPPIHFRRESHRSKCRSLSSLQMLLSSNDSTTTTSSSLLSSYINLHQDYYMSHNTSPINSSPALSFPSSRIPFSWEKHPGIPKQQKEDSKKKLPLPPAGYSKRHSTSTATSTEEMMSSFREDPFLKAMVECSKDKTWRGTTKQQVTTARSRGGGRRSISNIITSHLSDRIGMINMYGSCKSSCSVSESSIVHLPSTTTYSKNYLLRRDGSGGGDM